MFGLEYFRHWFGARPVIVSPMTVNNPLAGKPLRYLIGAAKIAPSVGNVVTVVPFDEPPPAGDGLYIAYCNLFDEHNHGLYGPYLKTSGTAREYNEGQIDPRGPGWTRNLEDQFRRRKQQGFEYIELDNPDAYEIEDVIGAIEIAAGHGLKVIAKNPGLMEPESVRSDRVAAIEYVRHPNIYGIIVEKGAGNAADMDELRQAAGKPDLPVWFVAFGDGRSWANKTAIAAKPFKNMHVTYSDHGEYVTSVDV